MEEEIIIIVKPPQNKALAADSLSTEGGATVHTFANRADAIAFLAGPEATDDRS